jgi:D-tyrosyl-tRNA(Tyr) deacylase
VRVLIQRVSRARVRAAGANAERDANDGGETLGEIGRGLLLLVGAAQGDTAEDAERLAVRCAELRIFPDDQGKFDRSLLDMGGEALVVSQFTLLADTRKGRRPSFTLAARPEEAEPLIERFAQTLERAGVRTARGRFGASMSVELVNEGPVTILIESPP